MIGESTFRTAFWLLMAGMFIMRLYFSFQVRRAGRRLGPDWRAVQREGWGMFTVRVILFFGMIAMLAAYALN